MTYKDYFVAEVKCNGKIMRVKDGAIYLPYGSEYTLLLKNLNSRKASVDVSIDGEDVLDNSSLIIAPNSETELEGYLSGNVAKNSFRFIHKTKQISDHRGDRADDGLIRIEFAFEKPQPKLLIEKAVDEVHHHYHYHNDFKYDIYRGSGWSYHDGTSGGPPGEVTCYNVCDENSRGISSSSPSMSSSTKQDQLGVTPNVDEGITVKGSQINQQFCFGFIGDLEESQVIVFQLKGTTETGKTISKPVTVKTKLTCNTCGTKSKSSMKFCGNCGTFLE